MQGCMQGRTRKKPKSARFKQTTVASGIYYYNELNNINTALPPKKFKALIQKVDHYGALPKIFELSENLNPPKQNKRKRNIKVAIPKVKKYPGAPDSH